MTALSHRGDSAEVVSTIRLTSLRAFSPRRRRRRGENNTSHLPPRLAATHCLPQQAVALSLPKREALLGARESLSPLGRGKRKGGGRGGCVCLGRVGIWYRANKKVYNVLCVAVRSAPFLFFETELRRGGLLGPPPPPATGAHASPPLWGECAPAGPKKQAMQEAVFKTKTSFGRGNQQQKGTKDRRL